MNHDQFLKRLKAIIGTESVRSFATKCGVSEGGLRYYLRGEGSPTIETLFKIAEGAQVDPYWLLTGGQIPQGERPKEETKGEKAEERRIIEYGRRKTDQPLSPPMRLAVEALLYLEKEDPAGFMLLSGKIIERQEKAREYDELKKMGTGDA